MINLTQPLSDEHQELLPHIENLRQVADELDEFSTVILRERIDDIYRFLTRQLIPHARAEDQILYPAVGKILGSSQATAVMSRDHVEIERLTTELATLHLYISGKGLSPSQTQNLRRLLYGLYTLIKVHLAKEEEIYFPLLDEKLGPTEATQIFRAMEEVARETHFHSLN
jgi:iron-sulfur cluster repair protein YtfE (RIC family)